MPRFNLSRRSFLRGLAGGAAATVALPALEAMFNANGTAHSDGSPLARRLVCFHFGNGVTLNKFVPAATGANWQLTPQLAPLANVKEYCNVLTGFENKHAQKITHHEGMAGMWSAHPFIGLGGLNSKFGGPSIDQVAAQHVGRKTTFPSLEIGCSKRVSTNEGPTMQFMSHKGPDQPMNPEYNPLEVFRNLFSTPPPDDPSRPSRVDVLDAVLADAKALKTRVSRDDSRRIDAHLASVEQLQAQISALPPACVTPPMPTQTNTDVGGKEPMEAVSKAMSDLLVYAFACDLTRVVSYMLTPGVGASVYHFLGTFEEQHVMSHDPVGSAEPLHKTIVWNIEQYAYLLERLKATPDGAGSNLLDNSCVLLGSDCSEGWSHSIRNMAVVVAGGGGGMLRVPGGHVRAPSRNLSDVLLTCVRTVAPEVTEIGSAEMRSTTTVTEIMR
jgi:hypothetical protein